MTKKIATYWTGKSVVVTGASSGLGKAVVEALAPFTIRFCLLSRREEPMLELANSLKSSGSTFWVKRCDVQVREQVYAAIQEFHSVAGSIDAVWVNSGIGSNSSFEKWNWEDVEATIDTNLKGAIYTTRACLEAMVPQGRGTVIAIGSAASMRGLPTRGIYSLTKIGLHYFIESLAAELPMIQFTMIHPGYVETPIISKNMKPLWVMPAEKAARIMIAAVADRKKLLIYPFPMKVLYRLVKLIPLPLYVTVARKIIRTYYRKNYTED
ncbi:MAG: SDR family NAD(P)-dependent oxidoreductase [Candidatus Zhuqueibacterota bacterium]